MSVLEIEDEVNPPKLEDHEVAITDTNKDEHPNPPKPIPLGEMLTTKHEGLEYQQYADNIGLSTSPFDYKNDVILVH